MKLPMVKPRPPHHLSWAATRLVLMLMCLAILTACGQSTPPRSTSSATVSGTSGKSPDKVHIVVTSVESLPLGLGTWPTVIFDKQVSAEANAIYRQLTSGTDVAGKVMSCPAEPSDETYYRYVLTFYRGETRVATATDDARGCGVFTIERFGGSTAYVFWANDHEQCFWDYLHKLVNAPEPVNFDTGTLCSAGNAVRSPPSPLWTED